MFPPKKKKKEYRKNKSIIAVFYQKRQSSQLIEINKWNLWGKFNSKTCLYFSLFFLFFVKLNYKFYDFSIFNTWNDVNRTLYEFRIAARKIIFIKSWKNYSISATRYDLRENFGKIIYLKKIRKGLDIKIINRKGTYMFQIFGQQEQIKEKKKKNSNCIRKRGEKFFFFLL